MPYATQQDCIDAYGTDAVIVATDRDGDGSIDTSVLDKALEDATAEIDSYVAGLPGFPFDPVPDSFRRRCVDIALYLAAPDATSMTEERKHRYEMAISYFKLVGQQKIRLPQDSGQSFVKPNATASIQSKGRVFSREDMGKLM